MVPLWAWTFQAVTATRHLFWTEFFHCVGYCGTVDGARFWAERLRVQSLTNKQIFTPSVHVRRQFLPVSGHRRKTRYFYLYHCIVLLCQPFSPSTVLWLTSNETKAHIAILCTTLAKKIETTARTGVQARALLSMYHDVRGCCLAFTVAVSIILARVVEQNQFRSCRCRHCSAFF